MKNWFLIFSIAVLALSVIPASSVIADAAPVAAQHGCFTKHIDEALQSNSIRKQEYSQLTHGATEKVSTGLLFSERITKNFGIYFDVRFRPYEDAGISFLCRGFESMKSTPAFSDRVVSPEPGAHLTKIDAVAMNHELSRAYKSGGYGAIERAATDDLARLGSPQYNCMLRHTIASLRRFAQLAPGFEEAVRVHGMKSPKNLVWRLLQSHLLAISQVTKLDEEAAEFQAKGIPILCNDVPAIPDHL